MKGDSLDGSRKTAVRTTLEAIYVCTHFLVPFIPEAAGEIFKRLGTSPVCYEQLDTSMVNLAVGTAVTVGDVLFTKFVSDEDRLSAEEAKKKNAADLEKKQKEKKAKKEAANKKAQENQAAADGGGDAKPGSPDQSDFTKADIRVGKITKVWLHDAADKLFCEEVDVGEAEPRQIASGLRGHYTLEDLHGRLVCVVCNLKSSKIVGFASAGMVLAAKGGDKVELVSPPEGSKVGERVFVEGLEGEPFSAMQMKKKKTWDAVAKDLKTDGDGQASWKGGVVRTEVGPCKAESLGDAPIS